MTSPRPYYTKHYAAALVDYFAGEEDIPTFLRFARQAGVPYRTLRRWRERYPTFRAAWEEAEKLLEDRLVLGGLQKRLDPSFCKFVLTMRFGWEEQEQEDFCLQMQVQERLHPDGEGTDECK